MKLNKNSPMYYTSLFSLFLAILKLIAYFFSSSLILLNSALDSFSDAVVSMTNNAVFKKSRNRRTKKNPYGFGYFEVLASLFQSFMLIGFGVYIFTRAIAELFGVVEYQLNLSLQTMILSVGVMLFSAFSGWGFVKFLNIQKQKLHKEGHRSLALNADIGHYFSDFAMNIAGAIGILGVYFFDQDWIDAVFAIIGSIFVIHAGVPILYRSMKDVIQSKAPGEVIDKIKRVVITAHPKVRGLHHIRARYYGSELFMDFHLQLPDALSLKEAHDIGDFVMNKLKEKFPISDINIHLDPESEPIDDFD